MPYGPVVKGVTNQVPLWFPQVTGMALWRAKKTKKYKGVSPPVLFFLSSLKGLQLPLLLQFSPTCSPPPVLLFASSFKGPRTPALFWFFPRQCSSSAYEKRRMIQDNYYSLLNLSHSSFLLLLHQLQTARDVKKCEIQESSYSPDPSFFLGVILSPNQDQRLTH